MHHYISVYIVMLKSFSGIHSSSSNFSPVMLKLIGVWETPVFPLPEQGQRSDSLQQPGTGRNPAPCCMCKWDVLRYQDIRRLAAHR